MMLRFTFTNQVGFKQCVNLRTRLIGENVMSGSAARFISAILCAMRQLAMNASSSFAHGRCHFRPSAAKSKAPLIQKLGMFFEESINFLDIHLVYHIGER